MLSQMPALASPPWLTDLSNESIINEPFPLHDVLRDSLYYPSSGFDGDPVKHLAGNILSFIYVDYGYGQDDFLSALAAPGFSSYNVVATRSVTQRELAPNGWNPTPLNPLEADPYRYGSEIKEPFCSWSILELRKDFPTSRRPSRFSLLYLCADGVAAYQALYVANASTPKAVAVIQPGHGFGNNWTDFTDPNSILHKTVLGNPSGVPEVLLYGGYGSSSDYQQPCWPEYRTHVCFVDKSNGRGNTGVWLRSPCKVGPELDCVQTGPII